jgi:hypothetical protein
MYPACVNGVQSDMLNGTSNTLANVLAINVLPTPEGPSNNTLLFSIVNGLSSCSGEALVWSCCLECGPELGGYELIVVCCWPGNSSSLFQSFVSEGTTIPLFS